MNFPSPQRNDGPARVVSTPGILGGMPCLAGTRIPGEIIRVSLNAGESRFEIYCGYPPLPIGAIEAVLEWAQAKNLDVQIADR